MFLMLAEKNLKNIYEPGYTVHQKVLIESDKEEIREIIETQKNNKALEMKMKCTKSYGKCGKRKER